MADTVSADCITDTPSFTSTTDNSTLTLSAERNVIVAAVNGSGSLPDSPITNATVVTATAIVLICSSLGFAVMAVRLAVDTLKEYYEALTFAVTIVIISRFLITSLFASAFHFPPSAYPLIPGTHSTV